MKWTVVSTGAIIFASIAFCLWMTVSSSDLTHVVEWFREHHVFGGFLYVFVFAASIVACLPATMFELAAGYLFGFSWGWVIAATGKTLGSVISFALGRYYLQGWVHKLMNRGPPIFRALALLLSRSELKWKIVILTRIAWMPIAIKNYGLSVLPVSFTLFFWSMFIIGSLFTAVSVYLGQTATHLSSIVAGEEGDSSHSYLKVSVLLIGAISAVSLVAILGYHTRRHLEDLAKGSENELEPMQSNEVANSSTSISSV